MDKVREIVLELKISLDQHNYVLIEQETESDQKEYSYKVI